MEEIQKQTGKTIEDMALGSVEMGVNLNQENIDDFKNSSSDQYKLILEIRERGARESMSRAGRRKPKNITIVSSWSIQDVGGEWHNTKWCVNEYSGADLGDAREFDYTINKFDEINARLLQMGFLEYPDHTRYRNEYKYKDDSIKRLLLLSTISASICAELMIDIKSSCTVNRLSRDKCKREGRDYFKKKIYDRLTEELTQKKYQRHPSGFHRATAQKGLMNLESAMTEEVKQDISAYYKIRAVERMKGLQPEEAAGTITEINPDSTKGVVVNADLSSVFDYRLALYFCVIYFYLIHEAPTTSISIEEGFLLPMKRSIPQPRHVTCTKMESKHNPNPNPHSFILFNLKLELFNIEKCTSDHLQTMFYIAWAVDFMHDFSMSKRRPYWTNSSKGGMTIKEVWLRMFRSDMIVNKFTDVFNIFLTHSDGTEDVENNLISYFETIVDDEWRGLCSPENTSLYPVFYINNALMGLAAYSTKVICTLGSIIDSQIDCGGCKFKMPDPPTNNMGWYGDPETSRYIENKEMSYEITAHGLYKIIIHYIVIPNDDDPPIFILRITTIQVRFFIWKEFEVNVDYLFGKVLVKHIQTKVKHAFDKPFQEVQSFCPEGNNYINITHNPAGRDKNFVRAVKVAERFDRKFWTRFAEEMNKSGYGARKTPWRPRNQPDDYYYMGCVIHYFQKYLGDHLQECEAISSARGDSDFFNYIKNIKNCSNDPYLLGLINNDRPSMIRYNIMLYDLCCSNGSHMGSAEARELQYQKNSSFRPQFKKTYWGGGYNIYQNGGYDENDFWSFLEGIFSGKESSYKKSIFELRKMFPSCLCNNKEDIKLKNFLNTLDTDNDGRISQIEWLTAWNGKRGIINNDCPTECHGPNECQRSVDVALTKMHNTKQAGGGPIKRKTQKVEENQE